ncbi:MAG: hypothetical protein Kow0074_03890 [Candidatus Zixiibacteriota bacterium]
MTPRTRQAAESTDVFDYFESHGSHVLGDDPQAVDHLERELSGLWSSAREAGAQGAAVYRLALSNLVILGDIAQEEELALFASTYAAAYPSRVILALRDAGAGRLTAHMSASCRKNPSGEGVVCWEKIDLRCPHGRGRSMASAIRALLIGRIATVAVIATPVQDRWILNQFLRWGDLIVTSENTLDAAAALLYWDTSGNRDAMAKWMDRTWITLEPVRWCLARLFDDATTRRTFAQCRQIEVTAPTVTERALLAGWLISRLEWRLIRVHEDLRTAELRDGNRRFSMRFTEGRDTIVVITDADGATHRFDLTGTESDRNPCVAWTDPEWSQAIIDALHQEKPDRVFLSAADAARRLRSIDVSGAESPRVQIAQAHDDLARSCAARVAEIIQESVDARGRCRIALAGGSTPEMLYRRLAKHDGVPWDRIDWFWGDERWVPHDHPDSNYRMAREALLESINVTADQIHPIPTSEDLTPEVAAEEYETTIRDVFGVGAGIVPQFDLVLLGLGSDGHTASLFPSVPLDLRDHRLVWGGYVAEQNQPRVTLTPRVLNAARHIVFLVTGEKKADMVAATLYPAWENRHPAARLEPCAGSVEWFLDKAAAEHIDLADVRSI